MAKVEEFNTSTPQYPPEHREVYHDQSECKFGKAIKPEHRLRGRGGKKHCSECERLG
ncbi:hypothetical protein [Sorangium sp. So ce1335]|uniref:hypothetical protein n=1 Tax=Sorangium sp. So ce1335 TaxID=3133335 RepID=UPI003F6075D3